MVELFKNETPERPIDVKNLYHYLSQLEFIVFMLYDEDGVNPNEIYFRDEKYKDKDCAFATLFVDQVVFDEWRGQAEVNYKVIKYDDIYNEILRYNTSSGKPCIAKIFLTWNEEEFYYITLDFDDVCNFSHYVLMYNSISNKSPYLVGTPRPDLINYEFLNVFAEALKKYPKITTAYYAQVSSPGQEDENLIESHEPNKSYFTIVYDTEDAPEEYWDLEGCLYLQNTYQQLAKEMGYNILIVHKRSQVGSLITQNEANTFYKKQ